MLNQKLPIPHATSNTSTSIYVQIVKKQKKNLLYHHMAWQIPCSSQTHKYIAVQWRTNAGVGSSMSAQLNVDKGKTTSYHLTWQINSCESSFITGIIKWHWQWMYTLNATNIYLLHDILTLDPPTVFMVSNTCIITIVACGIGRL